MTLREYAKLMNDTALQGSLSIEEYNRLYKPLLDGIQSMIPPMLFRYRSCNELSLQALWDDKIWLSKGNVMNDDYDALLYFTGYKRIFTVRFGKGFLGRTSADSTILFPA